LRLNEELCNEKLFCGSRLDVAGYECGGDSLLGYLGPIRIQRQDSLLIIETSFGILCGYDESAYAYQCGKDGWRRIWMK